MAATTFRFFGTGQLQYPNGENVSIRSRKQLALLVYLLMENKYAHSRDSIMALFWAEQAMDTARNNLRVTLSRLRKVVSIPSGTDSPTNNSLISASQFEIQINPDADYHLDVTKFEELLQQSRVHVHASRAECADCQPLLEEAVALYQDEFLAGMSLDDCPEFEEWLFMQRERHHLLAIEACTDLATFAEQSGNLGIALQFSRKQIELDLLRESAYRQQMWILAQQGERSLALASFERCRSVLESELGVEPEPETLALHAQILNSTVPIRATSTHPQTSPQVSPQIANSPATSLRHNLPPQLTSFIGRENEMAELQASLSSRAYRLLSIVGPGGIGKSRLAQQVAATQLNDFRDGVYFVSLAQVPATEAIPLAIAETLHFSFRASDKSEAEQLFEMLSRRELLLILDNFEHLIEGADLLVPLLQHAPEVMLLVTSRERLNLNVEDLFELRGLALPTDKSNADATQFASVRLFVDRAHRLDKRFKITAAQLPHVGRICQLVEGLPLAIELAATWIRDLTCVEIEEELVDGLDRLETTARDIAPQHRSLRAIFDSSWQLLTKQERHALAKLAVFSGGFTLDSADAVAAATPALLSALRNKSLIRHAGSRRYDMHALVHQFAAEALENDVTAAAEASNVHSHFYLTLLADQAVALDTRAAGTASALIQPEWENITIAWQRATAQMNVDLLQSALNGLARFCDLRGLHPEAQALLEKSVARLEESEQTRIEDCRARNKVSLLRLHCCLLTELISIAESRGHFERVEQLVSQALILARKLNSQEAIINIYLNHAKALEWGADNAKGIALAEKTMAMAQAEGLDLQAGICMELIGYNAYGLGDYERSQAMYQRLLAYHEQTGRLEQHARLALSILGRIAIKQGRYETGLTYFQRFFESSQAAGDRLNTAHAYNYLAESWNHLGHYSEAVQLAEESIVLLDALGDLLIKDSVLFNQGYAYRQQGKLAEAWKCTTDAIAVANGNGWPLGVAQSLAHLAEMQLAWNISTEIRRHVKQKEVAQEEVAATFQEAATQLRACREPIQAYEAEIGLAELSFRCGAITAALNLVRAIAPHLPVKHAEGWDEPIRAYMVCTRILEAAQDPAAQSLLGQGIQLLDNLAQRISDFKLRQDFLNKVPANQDLRRIYAESLSARDGDQIKP